ncbi:MAG: dihydrolipoamide acetyltransferase family protein [Desulfuromonadaceae bacterium]|nr:dihydrolipoamide acetyltransferase family protein [Desulfuromonadaceae bacterium]
MLVKLFIPKLGMTMEKATIAEWRYKDGDTVEKDSTVLVIDTEKVANDIEAPVSGKLVINAAVGDELPCGAIIGYIAETREEYEIAKGGAGAYVSGLQASVAPATEDQKSDQHVAAVEPVLALATVERIKISPLARSVAKQNDIDYAGISGSGPGGRIVKHDIEVAMTRQAAQKPAVMTACPGSRGCGSTSDAAGKPVASIAVASAGDSTSQHEGKRIREVRALKGMRKAISEHMHHSHSISAPISVMFEVDMTEMVKFRNRLLEKWQTEGVRLTYTDIFIMIVAKALKKAPLMNSSLINNEIIIWDDINIGIGASVMLPDGESGLVVPVIRNADKLSLGEISAARKDLTDKARNGTLSMDEMTGGTFTITNTASLSPFWHIQTPIIHQPQAAILGTASIVDRPVVKDGEIVVRPIMPMYLTFDHRIVDGGPTAVFNSLVHGMMSDPDLIFI